MDDQKLFTQNEIFTKALGISVANASEHNARGNLLIIRINNFPMIVANYGKIPAEKICAQLHEEISKLVKEHANSYYIDNCYIAVVFNETERISAIWIEKIHFLIQRFGCTSATVPIHLVAAMGSVEFPASANNVEQAIECALLALYAIADDPPSYYFAYENIEKKKLHAKHQMILANYMQNAILNKRLRLAFQPIIHSQTGHVMYHESLLRVVDDNGKISSAGPFIPVAESLGFIDVIDDLVLEMVIAELRHSPDIMLSFNISNLTVGNEKWLNKAKQLLKNPDIATRIVVEMTETAMHGDMKKVSNFIATLQGLGCQIAVDDFGAGYTSFRQLKSLPVDIVKIDGYFVKDIVDNSDNRLFVKTLLDFTNGLGLKAVAEFVETGEIAKLLMELKVDYMQGNYFCPAVNCRSWLKEERYA